MKAFTIKDDGMLIDKTILPIISEVKSIFENDIIDFAILNDQGYRYTHTNKLFQYSIDIVKRIDYLQENKLPYDKLMIENCQTFIFYDLVDHYFAVMVGEPYSKDISLDDFHSRLLEVSFFKSHLNLFLRHGSREDYALIVTDFDGNIKSSNQYASNVFTGSLKNLDDLKKHVQEKDAVTSLFNDAINNQINQSYDITTNRSVKFVMNAFVDAKGSLITFIFKMDSHASFYLNILKGFDFLRMGIAHFELVEENGDYTDARIIYTNVRYTELMGINLSDRIGQRIFELYPDYDEKRFRRYKEVALGAPNLSFEEYVPQIDKYLEIYCYSPRKGEFVNIYYDTSHLYIAKESEQYQIDKIRMMSSFAEMGFFEINVQDKTFECDQYVLDLFEQSSMDYACYRSKFKEILDKEYRDIVYQRNNELLEGKIREGSARFKVNINGVEKYLEYYLKTSKRDPHTFKPITILGLVREVTEEENTKQKIEFFANHDALTKLYSRHHFNQRIRNNDIKLPVTLALLDLDGLKTVNDVLGHYSGDAAIKAFVEILNRVYHDTYITRVGGDEFVVLFEEGADNLEAREKEIKQALKESVKFNIPFSVSIGYAEVTSDEGFKDALLAAEEEMYRHKLIDRPKRKQETLNNLENYLIKREPEIVERNKLLVKHVIPLMKNLNFSRREDINTMSTIVRYHAIGRIGNYIHRLDYQSTVDDDYYKYLRVETGFKIVSTLFPEEKVSDAILHQCEHYDGTGKPHGLDGEEIPIFSRIVAVVFRYLDLLDKTTKDEAIKTLRDESSRRFDPLIVKAFIDDCLS